MPSSDTANRNTASRLAATDRAKAMHHTRQIESAWFKCQALSYVAFHTPQAKERNHLLEEAFSLAESLGEPNRIVTVSAWPLRVAAQYWSEQELLRKVEHLLEIIVREPSPVRRADALVFVLVALKKQASALPNVVDAFAAACFARLLSGKRNRRGESWFTWALPIIAYHDPTKAAKLCEKLEGPVFRSRAAEVMARAENLTLADLYDNAILPG